MALLTLDDLSPGQTYEAGPIRVTRDELVAFARDYDPQPFHLDEAAATNTFVGTLIGSGWQTAALGMRLLAEALISRSTSMGSPGITALRWVRPVLPGDSLSATIRVEEVRPSASKPDRGMARLAMTLKNGRGETVMTQDFAVLFARAGAVPAPRTVELASESGSVPEPEDAERLSFLGQAEIGMTRDLGAHRFEAEAIVAFARAYDPQVFHLDAEAARATHFGALCASGWQTAAVWMKRLNATFARDIAFTARSGPVPQLGPSPGFKDLQWLRPVYAGDTIRYASRLVDRRASASRPGWGIATHHNTAQNQRGEPVFAFTGSVFWQWEP
ncbi:MaoC family dehydratase [Methylobacterium sp. B4]|uniref:MaoC family dehydratase n=1 Tax=Methylobacterium sp. B4 TaxID=1938755 RepID=UPI000D752937|nr:MaoC family dehydratase [Methylobacterium sp. B4]PXW57457.1 acyl dehydratase [Methylobacterium sp. B4]